jgi:CDP-glucose 4,6-dehydratase
MGEGAMLDFYNGKRVFVTGHTGFKGAWLCRLLAKAGAEVAGYALEPPTAPSLFGQIGIAGSLYSHETGDILDFGRLQAAVRGAAPQIVIHLAAQPLVRASYGDPRRTYETNVMGTVNVLEAIRGAGSVKSFVNVTTDKVYENREWFWGYRENENLNGGDPYSNSKSCSELVTHSYRRSFFSGGALKGDAPAISTARSGNVIGGGDYAEDRIIPDCVRAAAESKEAVIRNPRSTRPYQHVLDCLYGYLLLAKAQYADREIEGAYNFGPGEGGCAANGELAAMFCDIYGRGASWRAGEAQGPHEAGFLKLDSSKSKAVLGWKPQWGIRTAVEKTVEFAKAGGDSARAECVDRQIDEYLTGVPV